MSKRRNDRQITKDDAEDEGTSEIQATNWKETNLASKATLSRRKILSVRRKSRPNPSEPTSAGVPSFNFGGGDTKVSAPSFKFGGDTNGGDAKVSDGQTGPKFSFGGDTGSWDTKNVNEGGSKGKGQSSASMPVFKFSAGDDAPEKKPEEEAPKGSSSGAGKNEEKTETGEAKGETGGVAEQTEKPKEKEDEKKPEYSFGSFNASDFTFGSNSTLDTSFQASTSAPIFKGVEESNFNFNSNAPVFGGDPKLTFESAAKEGSLVDESKENTEKGEGSIWTGTFELGESSNGQKKDQFKDAKPANKGDDNDEVLYKTKSKVYELSGNEGERSWKERGKGDLHINSYSKDGKRMGRIILRTDSTKRLVLNCPIHSGMDQKLHADRFIRFLSVNITEDVEDHSTVKAFLVKFKTKTEAEQALEHISKLVAPSSSST
mmetsp:Transcript_30745/g.74956  ORF Transcript_30745/g.74956 Transcript_30745/m.74956 type:complete len:432 (-) Transcript_30745:259-1554(-)|eukprot:CAMPEP_0114526780 /NCGR_PEP_ID=MMETSP0109-20121206/23228_1 /TAXON_ID=29199 /ORGANISM="Chlorarachnion reptans, Strain CCCM449" /LENGTH=431 /DNA_ID=CAMNT_0001708627 /DNA_START=167 /DNA_END=1462 /DNA_ORIENTATION=+